MNTSTGVTAQVQVVAFVGTEDAEGRASVIANVAALLALAGDRVLVVTTEGSLTRYLQPFPAVVPPPEAVHRRARDWLSLTPGPSQTRGGDGAPAAGRIRLLRYALPDTCTPLDVIAPGGSPSCLSAPRAGALPPADYDVVLLDRLPGPGTVPAATGPDAGVAVLCVPLAEPTPRQVDDLVWSLLRAAGDARRVVAAIRPARIEAWRAGQLRTTIQQAVAEAGVTDAEIVEVDPYGAVVDEPALIAYLAAPSESGPDDPGSAGAAEGTGADQAGQGADRYQGYGRLTAAVRGCGPDAIPVIRPRTRARHRRVLGLEPAAQPEVIYLAYAVSDRPWADRVADQLSIAGAVVRRLPDSGDWWREEPAPSLVMFGPPDRYPARVAAQVSRVGAGTDVVYVERPGDQADPMSQPPAAARRMCLSPDDPTSFERALLAHFGLPPTARPDDRLVAAIPAPGRSADGIFEFPQRNAAFVGREAELEALRDELRAPSAGGVPLLRVGAAGVGKSELVREYANRFAYDYDLVWWVPGDSVDSVQASLSRLATEIEPRVQAGEVSAAASLALDALDADRPSQRWLLIYDNVDDLGTLDGLLPRGGSGRVLVTTRSAGPEPARGSVVERLDPADSLTLLTHSVPGLATQDAEWLAEWAGHLPLSLRLAAKWLRHRTRAHAATGLLETTAAARALQEYRQRISEAAAALPPTSTQDQRSPVAAAIAVTVGAMRADPSGRLPVQLAQVCAFLSPEGASLALLRSRPMLASLIALASADGAQLAADSIELDRVLWTAAQFGLLEVAWSADLVRMHRLVADSLRAAMDGAEREVVRDHVLRGLAEYAPSDAEDHVAADRHRLTELRRHLEPSGALHADDRSVRRWVVAQIQHATRYGDRPAWEATLRLAEETRKRWREQPRGDEDLQARLSDQIVDLNRKLGRNTDPPQPDLQPEQPAPSRPDHLRTLLARLGRAAELRELGWFREALVEDNAVHEAFLRVVGDEHPDTLMSRHDLALSWFLNGDAVTARDLETSVLELREAQFGWTDPRTWRAAGSLGAYLRELGDPTARRLLAKAREKASTPGGTRSVAAALTIRRNLAVLRREGDPTGALEANTSLVQEYVDLLGADHPQTWAARLTLAADHDAVNRSGEAVERAEEVLAAFRRLYPEGHPFIGVCLVNLAVFLFRSARPNTARKTLQDGLDLLEGRFDAPHPWTLAARINQLPMRAAAGEPVEQGWAEAAALCRDFLVAGHPYTAVADNRGPFIVIEVPPT